MDKARNRRENVPSNHKELFTGYFRMALFYDEGKSSSHQDKLIAIWQQANFFQEQTSDPISREGFKHFHCDWIFTSRCDQVDHVKDNFEILSCVREKTTQLSDKFFVLDYPAKKF